MSNATKLSTKYLILLKKSLHGCVLLAGYKACHPYTQKRLSHLSGLKLTSIIDGVLWPMMVFCSAFFLAVMSTESNSSHMPYCVQSRN